MDGTENDDILVGDDNPNVINGLGGDDQIYGRGGDDTLNGGDDDDRLYGEDGSDTLNGGAGHDILVAGTGSASEGINTLNGDGGNDQLHGDRHTDTLNGGDGNDRLDGRSGIDWLNGGAGDDDYHITVTNEGAPDNVTEAAGEGIDTVYYRGTFNGSTNSYTLPANVERLFLLGETRNGTGNDLNNTIVGTDVLGNILDGGAGVDVLNGGGASDIYYVDETGDTVIEYAGGGLADEIRSTATYYLSDVYDVERLVLLGTASINATGNSLDNTLYGNSGNNVLNGRAGADKMYGGAGDDTYYVDHQDDVVGDYLNSGYDTVFSSISFSLAGIHIEKLVLTGSAAINATGNSLVNHIIGNSANNIIDGNVGGGDRLEGGLGNDIYIVDTTDDVIVDTGGYDRIQSSVTFSLVGHNDIENLTLTGTSHINATGNAGTNVLTGNSGDNVLDGNGGRDYLAGGVGNDTYVVDSTDDTVTESHASHGIDTVRVGFSYTLGAHLENLVLTGYDAINGTGNELANAITGNGNHNVLDGRGGVDVLNGGAGNDTYIVDATNETVIEENGGGYDRVLSSATYALSDTYYVEELVLTGSAHINATGNSRANRLEGNSGNNELNGGGGADRMIGGAGNDTYYVDNAFDRLVENEGEGIDTVYASVSFSLAYQHLDNLVLTGGAGINGHGNSLDNMITGNDAGNELHGISGHDVLGGGGGDDKIHGDLGNDSLTGGDGADGFYFDTALNAETNVDTIEDFSAINDAIFLDRTIFNAIASDGTLDPSAFRAGTSAQDADDRIVYDSATGRIWYDSDGSGGAAAILFAMVDPGTPLDHLDFIAYTPI